MFTGIIEELGTMRHIEKKGDAMVLDIGAEHVLRDVALGDSIAVNGVCLTVVQFTSDSFKVDVMPETFRLTSLARCLPGERVNLERAMAAQGRFGGHMVQGHVDGVGKVASRTQEQNAVVFKISTDASALVKTMIPKGSVALDGISLTLIDVGADFFTVSIIPHTLQETTLGQRQPGDLVNIETDMIGKYIQHFLKQMTSEGVEINERETDSITPDLLKKHGFLK